MHPLCLVTKSRAHGLPTIKQGMAKKSHNHKQQRGNKKAYAHPDMLLQTHQRAFFETSMPWKEAFFWMSETSRSLV
jgi:hypothetical protein